MTTTMLIAATTDFTRALSHACAPDSGSDVQVDVPESAAVHAAMALLNADASALLDERCVDVAERAVAMLTNIDDAAGLALQAARRAGVEVVAREVHRRRHVLVEALRGIAS